ncbi:MutS protein msh4 [Quaeritorhiza haematococci]|nr:MutS protein msh4 [Quaeritorhiza haematococci]
MLEMRETAFILENVSDTALIIIDELGRGTSTSDGLGITFAICEELVQTKAFCFFATHYQELAVAFDAHPNVVNLHLEVDSFNGDAKEDAAVPLTYLYTVKNGSSAEKHYGVKLAQIVGLPPDVVKKAMEVSSTASLQACLDKTRKSSQSSKEAALYRAQIQITQQLLQAHRSSALSETELRKYLNGLQRDFMQQVVKIEGIAGSSDAASSVAGSLTSGQQDAEGCDDASGED